MVGKLDITKGNLVFIIEVALVSESKRKCCQEDEADECWCVKHVYAEGACTKVEGYSGLLKIERGRITFLSAGDPA